MQSTPTSRQTTPPAPYYTDGSACECGCGELPSPGRRFISRHNLRTLEKTQDHRANIAEGQRRAWETKRERLPIGTRRYDHSGYVLVKVVAGAGHWRKEHALVMERELGRRLEPGEHVHHINAVKDDNRPENLWVCTGSAHSLAEASVRPLLAGLIADGLVVFDRDAGAYRRA